MNDMHTKCQRLLKKRGDFKPLKIRDLLKIEVILRQIVSEKGVFLNLENTDGLQVGHRSGGTAGA